MSRQEQAGSYLATKLVPGNGKRQGGCLTWVLQREQGLANTLNSDFSLQDHETTNFYYLSRRGRGHRLSPPFKSKTARSKSFSQPRQYLWLFLWASCATNVIQTTTNPRNILVRKKKNPVGRGKGCRCRPSWVLLELSPWHPRLCVHFLLKLSASGPEHGGIPAILPSSADVCSTPGRGPEQKQCVLLWVWETAETGLLGTEERQEIASVLPCISQGTAVGWKTEVPVNPNMLPSSLFWT